MKRSDFLKRISRFAATVGFGVLVSDDLSANINVLEQGRKIRVNPKEFNANATGICFYEPTELEKRELEKKIKDKFIGSRNAGKA